MVTTVTVITNSYREVSNSALKFKVLKSFNIVYIN